jgi:hypothetical protein
VADSEPTARRLNFCFWFDHMMKSSAIQKRHCQLSEPISLQVFSQEN